MENIFEELKRYVGFGPADEQALRAFHPYAQPSFERITETFYARILDHAEARSALEKGESTVGRLKVQLQAWLDLLLHGPWDDLYFELRCRIGRVHVRIALPQHYMFGAMFVIRQELTLLVDEQFSEDGEKQRATRLAVGKLLDLELAIMLHTYREDLLAQQAKVERLSAFGQMVGSIGHELRNPLGVMESSIYILRNQVTDERGRKHVERLAEQVTISKNIIGGLLDMIRDRPLTPQPITLSAVIRDAAAGLAVPPELALRLDSLDPQIRVMGDAGQLRQVMANLLENAIQAVGASGVVEVFTAVDGRWVEVAIEDSGPGIDPAVRSRLFEPLTTSKKRGIGLGLALVKRIVERHQGTIELDRRSAKTRFVIRLPRA